MKRKPLLCLSFVLLAFAVSAMELEIAKGGKGTFQYGAVSMTSGLLSLREVSHEVSFDDSGLIKLYMNMIVVDALTEKKRGMTKSKSKGVKDGIPMEPSGFRVRTMHPILRLSPGKPTVIECGDLRVTVTPKIVSS